MTVRARGAFGLPKPDMELSFMRPLILAFIAAAMFFAAADALAAPTCQDINGDTIRCGTPGAMPVGWTLSREERLHRQVSGPSGPSINELLDLICVLGMFFALIALMPEFDGWRTGDWDEQEDDDKERR
jgi:hypothetical protein